MSTAIHEGRPWRAFGISDPAVDALCVVSVRFALIAIRR